MPATDVDAVIDVASENKVDEPDLRTQSVSNGRDVTDRFFVPQTTSINFTIITFLKARSRRTLPSTQAFNALYSGTPTMIVDVHTHLPTHRDIVPDSDRTSEEMMRSGDEVSMTNSIADYLSAMEPVDKTFAFGIAPRPWGSEREIIDGSGDLTDGGKNHNDVAAELHKASPDKVIPFMSLHPMDPGMNDEYDRAVGDLGCKGIKLGPNYQDFDPVGEAAFKLYARLEADGLPIVFHQGTSPMRDAPLRYAQPLVMDQVAIAFPELRIVMAHLGHPWQDDCMAVVRKHPNVWADVSAQFYRPWSFWNGMRVFHEWGATQKILFASDWPVTVPQDNIDGLRNLSKFAKDHHLPGIPEDEIEEIINRDALDILGVE